MVDYSIALAWIIISPLAVLTDITAIVVIVHYHPFFHGTDVMMMSLMVAMAANALLVLPIPAFLELRDLQWNESLCSAYVWCFITFRVAQTMSLVAMTVHWSTVLKMSAEKRSCFSTKALKIATLFIWTISATVGLLPLIGAANDDYNEANTCKFLGFNLGVGFAIFFLIFNIAAMFVCVICTSDSTFLIKHMKRVAEVKYHAGRFSVPDKRAAVPSHGTSSISEKYSRLTIAWDLSKFVLIYSVASFLLNHFPFAMEDYYETLEAGIAVEKNVTKSRTSQKIIGYKANENVRRSTYSRRARSVVLAAKELEAQTHCSVSVDIKPTWANGKSHHYQSAAPDGQVLQEEHVNAAEPEIRAVLTAVPTQVAALPTLEAASSPKRRRAVFRPPLATCIPRKQDSCRICNIATETSWWIGCDHVNQKNKRKDCTFWVHQHCIHVYCKTKQQLKNVPVFCTKHAPNY